MASIHGNGSIKATATALYFPRIPILAPRYIRLEKRGIFRVAIEQKFGKGLCSGFKGCNAWMLGNGLYSAFNGWILSFDGRGSREEAGSVEVRNRTKQENGGGILGQECVIPV